jgi:hypothetical protein
MADASSESQGQAQATETTEGGGGIIQRLVAPGARDPEQDPQYEDGQKH